MGDTQTFGQDAGRMVRLLLPQPLDIIYAHNIPFPHLFADVNPHLLTFIDNFLNFVLCFSLYKFLYILFGRLYAVD